MDTMNPRRLNMTDYRGLFTPHRKRRRLIKHGSNLLGPPQAPQQAVAFLPLPSSALDFDS
jgi:hypothetical protein